MSESINPLNRVVIGTILLSALFLALVSFFNLSFIIILLNGVFIGAMSAIIVAYWELLKNSILGIRPYDRVRQMSLGFALCWAAYSLSVIFSIYLRTTDTYVTSSLITVAGRYVAIIGAILQVTAPDFGLGIFHGRDRKVLFTGIITGIGVAVAIVILQNANIALF